MPNATPSDRDRGGWSAGGRRRGGAGSGGAPGAGAATARGRAGSSRARGERAGSRLPRGSTRERILDVALDLFTERGYDKTSLREIADELGFTKAALYYHFERKEDILFALHLRLHALGRDALVQMDRIDARAGSIELWSQILGRLIEEVLANRRLFLLHARNHNALTELQQHQQHDADHQDFQDALQRLVANRAIPTRFRVRMACSIGAIMATIMGAADAFADVDDGELADLVGEAVRDLLGGGSPTS